MDVHLKIDPAYHMTGIAHSQRIFRNILCDNTSGADDRSGADGHARKDDDAAAQPASVFDTDGQGIGAAEVFSRPGLPAGREPFGEVNGMGCRIELNV